MKIANLLNKLKAQEPVKTENFFAVELTDDIVKSAVWTVINGHTQMVKLGVTKPWDGQNQEQLLAAADESISFASQNLSPEPNGVVFGLPDSWVDKDNINPEKKALLKTLCEKLTLKPLGFVVTSTAVIKSLKIDEGSPASAIFIQVNSAEINLSLVKLGKVLGMETVGRSGDLGADVEEGLSRFTNIDTLPSRMILFDGQSDFEEDKQQLTSYDWEEKLPFIHFPKVEALTADASVRAICLAGGSEVAKSLGVEVALKEPTAATLGFSGEEPAAPEVTPQPQPQSQPQPVPEKKPLRLKLKLPQIKLKIPALPFIGAGFGVLVILVFLSYWFLPKAKVMLFFEPKLLEENLTIKAGEINSETMEVTVEGNQTIPSSGTKIVGEPAGGDITIYNKTNQAKTFSAGTVLIGPNNFAFSLDEETTVASASAEAEGTTYGKAAAKITAKSIGAEGNLATGASLSFKQFPESDYYGRSGGLSGGSSREIKAVSKEDQEKLLAALTEELTNKAASAAQNQIGSGRQLISGKDKTKLLSKSFNHAAGEEAENLTLTAKLSYSGLSYSENELKQWLNEAVKDKVPAGYAISDSSEASVSTGAGETLKVSYQLKLLPQIDEAIIKAKIKGRQLTAAYDYFSSLTGFSRAEIVLKPDLPGALNTLPHTVKNISLHLTSL